VSVVYTIVEDFWTEQSLFQSHLDTSSNPPSKGTEKRVLIRYAVQLNQMSDGGSCRGFGTSRDVGKTYLFKVAQCPACASWIEELCASFRA
jgi:hypothetical protein